METKRAPRFSSSRRPIVEYVMADSPLVELVGAGSHGQVDGAAAAARARLRGRPGEPVDDRLPPGGGHVAVEETVDQVVDRGRVGAIRPEGGDVQEPAAGRVVVGAEA